MTTTAKDKTTKTEKNAPACSDDIIERYPRLTAHLICESLGYFTPRAAANAILQHMRGEPFYCEWYISAAGWSSQAVTEFGARTLERAFRSRKHHRGYMASYPMARALVENERSGGAPPMFSSWQ